MLSLLARACKDKHNYSYKIGEHLEELLTCKRNSGDIFSRYVKRAEYYRAEYSEDRLPSCKNDKCNAEPSDSVDYVLPVTVEIIHNEHKSTET